MPTLNVIIGLLLIFLFYSLLATTVMEMISGWLSFRGKHLEKALKNMLSSNDKQVFEQFKENPVYEQLAGRFLGKKSPPSYLDGESFNSILMKVLSKIEQGRDLREKIGLVPDDKLRGVLEQYLEDADYKADEFQRKVIKWYDSVMGRAAGWYKKMVQRWLIGLGFIIAVAFNADTLAVYNQLIYDSTNNPEKLEALVALADNVVGKMDQITEENQDSVYTFLNESLRMVQGSEQADPLGIGWSGFQPGKLSAFDWLWKIFGWMITALAISLGAPFWFDLLKKIINIRNAGNVPAMLSDLTKQREVVKIVNTEKEENEPVG